MVQRFCFNHVDTAAEGILKIGDQAAGKKRRGSGARFDQQVQVAVGTSFPPSEGSKDLDAGDTMAMRDSQNPGPVCRFQPTAHLVLYVSAGGGTVTGGPVDAAQ